MKSFDSSKNYKNFELNLKQLLESLKILEEGELNDALIYLKKELTSTFINFNWESNNKLDVDLLQSQQGNVIGSNLYTSSKPIVYDESTATNVQLFNKNCLCDKDTLDSCPIHCTVISLDNVSYNNILHDYSQNPYCESTYLDLSQREKISLDLDKENCNKIYRESENDSSFILDLCSKNKEVQQLKDICDKEKINENISCGNVDAAFSNKNKLSDNFDFCIKLEEPINSSSVSEVGRNNLMSDPSTVLEDNSVIIQNSNFKLDAQNINLKNDIYPTYYENCNRLTNSTSSGEIIRNEDYLITTPVINVYKSPFIKETNNKSIINLKKTPFKNKISTDIIVNEGITSSCSTNEINDQNKEKCDVALNLVSKKVKKKKSVRDENKSIDNCKDLTNNDLSHSSYPKDYENVVKLDSLNKSDLCPVSCMKCHCTIEDYYSHWSLHKEKCTDRLYCPHCDIHFSNKSAYHKHKICHVRNSCKKCNRTFKSMKLLNTHMKEDHNVSSGLLYKTYTCEYCSHVLKKKSSLYHHLKIHALPNQNVCQKCGLFIDGEAAYQSHLKAHFENAHLKCNICDDIFKRRQQYDNHMKGHKKNICKYCDMSFSSKKSLYYHCKDAHPTLPQTVSLNKSYKCDKCPRIFIRPSLLRDHKYTHTESNPFYCQACNIKFSQRSSLRKHLKTVLHKHTAMGVKIQNNSTSVDGKDTYICEFCGIIYPSHNLLKKHSLQVHHIGPTLKCSFCDYKTRRNVLLRNHTNAHLGLDKKRFMCELCGKAFTAIQSLKDHYKFLHSNERRYKCSVGDCDKTFKNKSCLSRHKKSHSSERPYKCDCGNCYKQLYHLVRHLSTAHSKKVKTRRIKRLTKEELDSLSGSNNISSSTTVELSISEVQEKLIDGTEANDFLLAPTGTVLMNEEANNTETTPLFTVLDSQLIHLIPSSLQLGQEGLQTLSLVSGELHSLSIGSSYSVTGNQESFANCEDELMIQSAQNMTSVPLDIEAVNTDSPNDINTTIDRIEINIPNVSSPKINDSKESLQIAEIVGETSALQFATNSLNTLHYNNEEALQSENYLAQETQNLSQEIGQSNISIF